MRRIGTVTAALATAGVLMAGANLLGRQDALGAGASGDPGPVAGMMAAMRGRQVPLAPAGSTFVKVYTVADILGGVGRGDADMTSLVELITSSVTPGVWKVMDSHGGFVDNQDGGRSIQPFARDLTLIIRQTAEGHDLVAERLEQIRQVLSIRDARSAPFGFPVVAAPPAGAQSRGLAAAMRMMGGAGASGTPGGNDQRNAQGSSPGQAGTASPMMNQPQAAEPQGQAGMMSSMMNQPQAARPQGQPGTMSSMMNPPADPSRMMGPALKGTDARTKGQSRAQVPAEGETERRLRAVEEKLDRVLKALDATRPDNPSGDALPR